MIHKNKELFIKPYYFFLTEKNDKISLYYSIGETILESRKIDEKIEFDKKDLDRVKKGISDIVKQKKIKTKDQIKKFFTQKSEDKEEIDELVDVDGTMSNSKIPILDKGLTPRKTTDQTVVAARMTNNPVTRGYRKYYGESIENTDNVVNEVDYSEAFGYEETKDMDGEETYNYLIKKLGMTPDEAFDRTKQFGKDPYGNKTKKAPKEIRNKKGFIDRMTLSEIEKHRMIKMVEDILLKNKNSDAEIDEKEEKVTSKIVKKNIQALKKMADKEGITINQLIKLLKSE
jgi:hypothetical protein